MISIGMRAVLWGAWAGLALAASGGAAQAQGCAQDLPTVCLQSFGAGSAAISPAAAGADCGPRLQSYRACIAALAQDTGIGGDAPLDRAERGFLSALEAELADNVGRLEVFIAERMDLTGASAIYENDWPPLRTRFFDATENPHYFIAPADWLARTQGFYDDVAALLARKDVRLVFRTQTTSILYERKLAREKLEALVSMARRELLPEISAALTPAPR